MPSIYADPRVLKLVHPGGFVEEHHTPVMAAHVMARNPRHLVTRPDVFKFPWIVVHPDSLLRPGNVFFIVPSRTLHRLLQSSAASNLTRKPKPSPRGQSRRPLQEPKQMPDAAAAAAPLRSCLKKPGSSRQRGCRRVAFNLPPAEEEEEEEEQDGVVRYPWFRTERW